MTAVQSLTMESVQDPSVRLSDNSESEEVVSPAPRSSQNDEIATSSSTADQEHSKSTTSTESTTSNNTSELTALKVLFLSSDTGGGHRASAESLANQFERLFPGSTYELLDVATESYLPPYNSIVSHYKHLSAHPSQWKLLYGITNSRAMERVVNTNIKVMSLVCERSLRQKIKQYAPDVVVSVHPLMTSVPILSCAKISHETGKHLPMFTVVTDLGSAHATWFANGVERMFVGSEQIYQLAKQRGNVPEEKLELIGLPIRHDFAVQAEQLGDRSSPEGKAYQQQMRAKLGLEHTDRKTLLVMGGGEGVGSLSNIVNAVYVELVKDGIDANILVVCGRNEKLKKELEDRDWAALMESKLASKEHEHRHRRGILFQNPANILRDPLGTCGGYSNSPATVCMEGGTVTNSLRRILSSGAMTTESAMYIPSPTKKGENAAGTERTEQEITESLDKAAETTDLVASPGITGVIRNQVKKIWSSRLSSSSRSEPEDNNVTPKDESIRSADNIEVSLEETQNSSSEIPTAETTPTVPHHARALEFKSNSIGAIHFSSLEDDIHELATEKINETRDDAATPVPDGDNMLEVSSAPGALPAVGKVAGNVTVVGLGFVTNMAEYMVAADILVSKAGPGTISEAAAVSLPVLLTSFLPGQEEGNVDYVVQGGFGSYCDDSDPHAIAEELSNWLQDELKLQELSEKAKAMGAPYAARNIVQQIGDSTLKWRELNEHHANPEASLYKKKKQQQEEDKKERKQ
jgi:UDP-N-acetylglucosamine:LPS N-acetylglucosamine transferase